MKNNIDLGVFTTKVKKVLAKRLQCGYQVKVPIDSVNDMDMLAEFVADHLVLQVKSQPWSTQRTYDEDWETYVPVSTIEVPLSWWDHFKDTFFPAWYLKKFPIKTKAIFTQAKKVRRVTETIHVCPHIHTDDTRMHMEFMVKGM